MTEGHYYCQGTEESCTFTYQLPTARSIWVCDVNRDHTAWDDEQLAKIFVRDNPDCITVHFLCAITGRRRAVHITPEFVNALP